MKKSKIIATLVASAVTASAFSTMLVGCKVGDPYLFEYEVYVVGGTGSGTYKDGDDCSVTAEIPEGKKFDKWVNEYGEVLSTANPYTFKVDGDTEIYAVTGNIDTYKVEVIGGTLTGTSDYEATVYAGERVSVTANSSNSHRFKEWLINGSEKSSANPYTFTATQDMKIEAIVDESYLVAVSGGTIEGADKSSKIFEAGEECTLTAGEAPVAGQDFICWYVTDEDGNNKVVNFNETYTFNVTGTDKYYAKFGVKRVVSIENGVFDRYPEFKTINVVDGDSLTISLDEENIPLTKGFAGWKINSATVSTDFTYRFDVTEDTTVSADLVDKTPFATPDMSANQLLRKRMQGGNVNDYVLELDRDKTAGTAFKADTECVTFYIYDSPYAAKDEWVGVMKLENAGGTYRLATKDGVKLWNVEGNPGNMWLDTKDGFNQGKGHRGNTMDIFKGAIESCGNAYGDDTAYYLAAQLSAKRWSASGDSEISAIGPQYFIKNDVAQHRVNIGGATVKGTNLTQVTAFKGQKLTLVHEKENFRYWRVNGEIVEDETGNELTITVSGEMLIIAVSDADIVNLTVEGGTIKGEDGGLTEKECDLGERVTIIADSAPAGKTFDYWYKLVGGQEEIISRDAECEIVLTENTTVYAKYCNLYAVTVVGGTVKDMESNADGVYTVKEGAEITIVLDVDAVPENKGFNRWSTGEETFECKFTVTEDAEISAEYVDLIKLGKPVNGNNEMFKVLDNGIIEMDRKNNKVESEFDNPLIDRMRFYFYTDASVEATEENAAGYVILHRTGNKFYFATEGGRKLWDVKGGKGDLYHDNAGEAGYASLNDMLVALIKGAVGEENFDPDTSYYVAMQSFAVAGSKYSPSDISAIGPQAFGKK